MIDPQKLSLRDLNESDISMIMDYWYRSPPGYIEAMGVDWAKVVTEPEYRETLAKKCQLNATLPESKINAVVILYEGRPIGFHTINPLVENDYGVFHAHVIDTSLRRQGIASHSYRMATRLFMKRFNLQKIIFKTPVQNSGANAVKAKIGIRLIGEEVVQNFNILKDGTRVKVYELTREEAERFNAAAPL
jgi:RimJ/RimL family protein N-acetyltransferase